MPTAFMRRISLIMCIEPSGSFAHLHEGSGSAHGQIRTRKSPKPPLPSLRRPPWRPPRAPHLGELHVVVDLAERTAGQQHQQRIGQQRGACTGNPSHEESQFIPGKGGEENRM